MTKYLRKISTPSKVGSTQVIDSLNSTSKTDALSADSGRMLNEKYNWNANKENYYEACKLAKSLFLGEKR